MSTSIDSLTSEVEKLVGKPFSPLKIDKRVYQYTFPPVFISLLVLRPNFIYTTDSSLEKNKHFSFTKLILWSIFISVLIIGCYVVNRMY